MAGALRRARRKNSLSTDARSKREREQRRRRRRPSSKRDEPIFTRRESQPTFTLLSRSLCCDTSVFLKRFACGRNIEEEAALSLSTKAKQRARGDSRSKKAAPLSFFPPSPLSHLDLSSSLLLLSTPPPPSTPPPNNSRAASAPRPSRRPRARSSRSTTPASPSTSPPTSASARRSPSSSPSACATRSPASRRT